ncbi:hypothetical protein [Nitrosophilus labii]|uniref:hypothetical protein n=1 Tax=Nitrosophilus labii TaxID=2706014 RepID=UPI0016572005|nr:hypothetical protein [Nitrosophilus labii]
MHRTQIYFEEELFEEIKKEAFKRGESISSYIRSVLKKEIKKKKNRKINFNEIAGLWEDKNMDLISLRESAWKK